MLQSHGRGGARGAAVHGDPARRPAGVDLPVQDRRRTARIAEAHARRRTRGRPRQRFADAVTAIWHGRAEIDRFNELVLRAGLTWQQVVDPAQLRKVPAAGRFSVQPVPHRDGDQRQPGHGALAGRAVRGAVRPRRTDAEHAADAQAAAAAVAADIDALVSLDTDRVLRAFASHDPGHAAHQLLRHRGRIRHASRTCCRSSSTRGLIDELPLPRPQVRDLRVLAAGRGRAPAVRLRGPRRPALVGPPGGLPHRDPRAWSRRRR